MRRGVDEQFAVCDCNRGGVLHAVIRSLFLCFHKSPLLQIPSHHARCAQFTTRLYNTTMTWNPGKRELSHEVFGPGVENAIRQHVVKNEASPARPERSIRRFP